MHESYSPGPIARILIHDEGAGAPSPELVERRARELAVIAGRAASEYTDDDFRQAKAELAQDRDPEEEASLPFEPGSGEVLGGRDHHAANIVPEDETTVGEELVREGLDEALHDEMLAARERDIRDGA